MNTPSSCGAGLAANAALPAKVSELAGTLAAILENHLDALDEKDAGSRPEVEAYRAVARALRDGEARLRAAARRMADSERLPMGEHDVSKMTRPQSGEVFARFVAAEKDLLALLRERIGDDEEMLAALRPPGASATSG